MGMLVNEYVGRKVSAECLRLHKKMAPSLSEPFHDLINMNA